MASYKKRRAFAVPVEEEITRKKNKTAPTQFSFPSDLGSYQMLLNFQTYKFLSDRVGELEQVSTKDSIALPLPANLEQAYNIEIDSKSALGPITEALAKGVISVSEGESIFKGIAETLGTGDSDANTTDALGTIAKQAAPDAYKIGAGVRQDSLARADAARKAAGKTKVPQTGAKAVAGSVGKRGFSAAIAGSLPKSVGNTIEASLGAIYNPVLAATFKGVPLRGHSFNWKLIPRNAQESANLNAIIRVIRRAMHPYLSGIRDEGGFILEYPEVLTPVLLMPDNDQNIFYKPGLITNFKVTHGKDQKAFFAKTGNPVVYDLQLDYTELDIITQEDFDALENNLIAGN